jgi:hypothetical protein
MSRAPFPQPNFMANTTQANNQDFNNTIDAIMSNSGNPNEPISISSSPSSSSPPTSSKTVFPNRRGPQTLQDLASIGILDNLRSSLEGYQATANYCLGGSIPISSLPTQSTTEFAASKSPITAPPFALRFDTPSSGGKVTFPSSDSSGLEQLLKACTPATFGSGGKDVLDETYRKAGKLDRANFSVDFHPNDYGILDAIAQTLLPSTYPLGKKEGREEHWGVKAELYKLNVSEECPEKEMNLVLMV